MEEGMYLEQINGPEDVKKLNISELEALSKEIREALLGRLSLPRPPVPPHPPQPPIPRRIGFTHTTTFLYHSLILCRPHEIVACI